MELAQKLAFALNLEFCEIQTDSVISLKENISKFVSEEYKIHQCSYNDLSEKYSVIMANPPFYEKGCGKLSDNHQKNISRHFLVGDIKSFLIKSHSLLNELGVMFIIRPSVRADYFRQIIKEQKFKIEKEKQAKNYTLFKLNRL